VNSNWWSVTNQWDCSCNVIPDYTTATQTIVTVVNADMIAKARRHVTRMHFRSSYARRRSTNSSYTAHICWLISEKWLAGCGRRRRRRCRPTGLTAPPRRATQHQNIRSVRFDRHTTPVWRVGSNLPCSLGCYGSEKTLSGGELQSENFTTKLGYFTLIGQLLSLVSQSADTAAQICSLLRRRRNQKTSISSATQRQNGESQITITFLQRLRSQNVRRADAVAWVTS